MIELEQEALLLNREMLAEVKNLIDDINEPKPSHLRQFIHPQWGSILGSEKMIEISEECKVFFKKQFETGEKNDEEEKNGEGT